VLTAAFDTELYGHWWYEGPVFLEEVARLLHEADSVKPMTPSHLLADLRGMEIERIEPIESSWGVDCDHSVWMNDRTKPMWEKIWELEEIVNDSWVLTPFGPWPGDFWHLQAQVDTFLREFLLMTASDWEFLNVYWDCGGLSRAAVRRAQGSLHKGIRQASHGSARPRVA